MAATPPELVTVALEGEVDLATIAIVRSTLSDAVAANPGCIVQIDMSRVTFLDSSGLGMLVGLHRRADVEGGSVRIVNPHARVLSVLELTRLDAMFLEPS